MIELQNNFTTPEQSKRLLELGVPADSADCFYTPMHEIFHDSNRPHVRTRGYEVASSFFGVRHDYIPCWSVGQLMKILCICYQTDMQFRGYCRGGMVESLINTYEDLRYEIDFSKLEE